ncbi:MAG: hypothetical protein OEV20_01965 [Actinomycetota bacterium]|nr:hypothetical protein [Actinomycetota bacterium]
MDLETLLGLQRQLSDRTRFPAADDVLRAVWECQDQADEAQQRGDQVQAREWLKMAELARSEYRQRYILDLRTGAPGQALREAPHGADGPAPS